MGFVSGQVLGGVLVQLTSWRAVFLVNVPVGLAAAALAPVVLGPVNTSRARATTKETHRLDVRGALLITSAVALVVFAVSQGAVLGWTSPLVIAAIVTAAAAAGFLKAETRHPEPLIRPGMLHRPGLRDGSALSFLLGLWNGGEMLILSLYLQQVLHESPLLTGLAIAPQGVAGFGMGLFGPRLARRLGVTRLLVLTGASAAIGFAVLTRLPAGGYSPVLLVVTLIGLGTAATAGSRAAPTAAQAQLPASPATGPRCSPPAWPRWPPPRSPGTPLTRLGPVPPAEVRIRIFIWNGAWFHATAPCVPRPVGKVGPWSIAHWAGRACGYPC